MRAGQRSDSGDMYFKQRTKGAYRELHSTVERRNGEGAAVNISTPAESHYVAARPIESMDLKSLGAGWMSPDQEERLLGAARKADQHSVAELTVREPMELPNFSGNKALKWEVDGLFGRVRGEARDALGSRLAARTGDTDYLRSPDQLFTHVPGKVLVAKSSTAMEHTAPTLAALAHRDLPGTVPMNQDFPSLTPQMVLNPGQMVHGMGIRGHKYSDAEVGAAQEQALENAFPTSLNATSRRNSFYEQLRLFDE